jgi:KipI family sensor histidine kinase inhibitor
VSDARAAARRIRDAGDSALVLELEAVIDPDVNARAIAIAAAVRSEALAGVRDVVSTYRSVAVFFDPLHARIESIAQALERASDRPAASAEPITIDVPVAYGGEEGPDLEHVARVAGLSPAEVIRRHTGRPYRVFMLGFVPGFAYMGVVDESIATPRRPSPRLRVPAGAVAIAGRQTGIYPQESPGGWQILGRTRVKPFDPLRTPEVLFAPGDFVRFVPVRSLADTAPAEDRVASPPAAARADARTITVVRPGMLTTVQDLGRWGHQDRGVPVAGPMDAVSHRVANVAVGNAPEAATLELTLLGPEIRFDAPATFAVAGADLAPTLDGAAVSLALPVQARTGATLRFGARRSGVRAYLALDGGVDVPPVLGSRATHVLSRVGGVNGRPVAAGDRLPLADRSAVPRNQKRPALDPLPDGGARLRVLPGPQDDFFAPAAYDVLQRGRYTISSHSDRMAYRLTGPAIARATDREMISDATFIGAVQVPPSGEPILLMADRQTSGGYPQIATVITADLSLAGQLAPGDWIEFAVCTRREALSALIAQEGRLLALQ